MSAPNEKSIHERAYALWEAEGRPGDRAHDHWVQAERELSEIPSEPDGSLATRMQEQSAGVDGGDLQGAQSSRTGAENRTPKRKAVAKKA